MTTTTSEKLIRVLKEQGLKLSKENIEAIRSIIYDSVTYAYAEGKLVGAGKCDCGQMNCPECHG